MFVGQPAKQKAAMGGNETVIAKLVGAIDLNCQGGSVNRRYLLRVVRDLVRRGFAHFKSGRRGDTDPSRGELGAHLLDLRCLLFQGGLSTRETAEVSERLL